MLSEIGHVYKFKTDTNRYTVVVKFTEIDCDCIDIYTEYYIVIEQSNTVERYLFTLNRYEYANYNIEDEFDKYFLYGHYNVDYKFENKKKESKNMKYYTWKEINKKEWSNGIFNTIEECIKDAKGRGNINNIDIGNAKPYEYYINANDILGDIENIAYQDFDINFEFNRYKKVDELSVKLTEVLSKWLKETNQELNFYHIDTDTIKIFNIKPRKIVKITFSCDNDIIGNAYYQTDEDDLDAIENALKNFKISKEIENDCNLLHDENDDSWYFNNINIGKYNTEELIGLISKIEIINRSFGDYFYK